MKMSLCPEAQTECVKCMWKEPRMKIRRGKDRRERASWLSVVCWNIPWAQRRQRFNQRGEVTGQGCGLCGSTDQSQCPRKERHLNRDSDRIECRLKIQFASIHLLESISLFTKIFLSSFQLSQSKVSFSTKCLFSNLVVPSRFFPF